MAEFAAAEPIVTLELACRPVLSYAMAHNEIPVVTRVAIEGVPRDLQGARLVLEVADDAGPIGEPDEIVLDLRAGEATVLTDLRLAPDPAAMLRVEEQRPATVGARLVVGERTWAEQQARVRLLAAHQWLATPPGLALELLAAHVQPNHPAVTALLPQVADELESSTGNPSIEGYQAGADRVDRIVEAVYTVLQRHGIAYAEPPASWADVGQKIRTPGEVLGDRVGTCLDTVVLMAAVLEQAGIRPLIWMADGHAFLGWWRDELGLDATVDLEPAGVVNQVDLDRIGLVETTALTRRRDPVPFREATALPRTTRLSGDLGHLIGIVDVRRARADRIVPLPARVRDADGAVHVVHYTPAGAPAPVPRSSGDRRAGPREPASARDEPARIGRWKNALLDLSLRNRLINFTERASLPLVVTTRGPAVLEDLLHGGRAFRMRALDEVAAVGVARGRGTARDLPEQEIDDLLTSRSEIHAGVSQQLYADRFRKLAHKARTIVEETGANNLYLALGTLVWELDGRSLRSPLVLVPVLLEPSGRDRGYRISLDEAGSSTPNFCLIEKLRQVHGLEIPGLTEPVDDDAGIDLDAAFDNVRAAIAERGLPFRVEATADLAILQFAKFRLWKDLDESWRSFLRNPLVAHLVSSPTEEFADPAPAPAGRDLDALDSRCPVPADSSQLTAIDDAVAGRTFVLEGPPGTGKSQTITNLLATAVAAGRTVLFVAEKRAALDVVQKRLDAVGLGPLALDLHDKGSTPTAVRRQIADALDLTVEADETGQAARTEALRADRLRLARYADRMRAVNVAGLDLYQSRDAELGHDPDLEPLPVPVGLLDRIDAEGVARLRSLFGMLPSVTDASRPGVDAPWGLLDRPDADAAGVVRAVARLDRVLPALPAAVLPAVRAARDPDELGVLADVLAAHAPLGVLDEVRTPQWASAVEQTLAELDAFRSADHPCLGTVTPDVVELDTRAIHTGAGQAAASGLWGRKKRLRAAAAPLAPVARPGRSVPVQRRRLLELTAGTVTLSEGSERLAGMLVGIPGLAPPAGWTAFDDRARSALDDRIAQLRRVAALVAPGAGRPAFLAALRESVHRGAGTDPAVVREAASATADLLGAGRVRSAGLAGWLGDQGFVARWDSCAAARGPVQAGDVPSLRHRLALLVHLEPLRTLGLGQIRSAVLDGEVDPDDARRCFDLGLARASVAERMTSTDLERFDATGHERALHRFARTSGEVRAQLREILPARLLAGRTFDPAATRGRIGELRRQLNRKRGGMRVRELVENYGDLITTILPCVLVSPDSLARFFPPDVQQFDVVVFDEASQVRVADAVGAMGRSRSAVVVGDSKQMPPTSFAEAVTSDDGEPGVVEDEESILSECVQARVHSHRLSWHYRSQDESLIAFSNQHYYDGGLSTFPAPGSGSAAVRLVRVDGRFHRSSATGPLRTNPVEAAALVDEVRRRFAETPHPAVPSVGIVTFNQPQRTYVEGLLRDAGDPRVDQALDDPNGLFVKNLENVQGDERDTILFSTAFSVNDSGVLPLNFGPLTRSGGERRLNVAVTRARREVVVFSSFDPAQIRSEETSSVGIQHLRTYLEMADRGPEVLPRPRTRRSRTDRHRDQIAAALRDRGVPVRAEVGLSDFTLDLVLDDPDRPNRPLVAVLLDGPLWSARATVRDRDCLPDEVLRNVLGWPDVRRVWMPDWLRTPDRVTEGLVEAVRCAAAAIEPNGGTAAHAADESVVERTTPVGIPVARPYRAAPVLPPRQPDSAPVVGSPDVSAVPTSAPTAAPEAPAPVDRASPIEEFRAWEVRPHGDRSVLDELPSRRATGLVRDVLVEIVQVEGPVPADRLARLAARAFGVQKLHTARRSAILDCLPRRLRPDRDAVVWPEGTDPALWDTYRVPAPDTDPRPLGDIPLVEIGNAMVRLVRRSAGAGRDELYRDTLAEFGRRKRTRDAVERLDLAVRHLVQTGRMRVGADGTLVVAA